MPAPMIKLLANRVLIELIEEQTRSGILLPENMRETNFGIIKAVGMGWRTKKGERVPIEMKVGDRVMIATDGGRVPIEIEGKKHWIMSPENILGVMEDATTDSHTGRDS